MSQVAVKRVHRSKPQPSVSLRSRSVSVKRPRSNVSRQVDADHAKGLYGGLSPLIPPYSLSQLDRVYESSNIIKPCVAAYITNIAMTGWDIVPVSPGVPIDEEERTILQSFIDAPNYDQSLSGLHAELVEGYERRGHGYIEVIRDAKGRVAILRGVPGSTMSLCPKNPTHVKVSYDVVRGSRSAMVDEYRTFRVFRQESGGQYVFFKEFGDPRRMSRTTGDFETPTRVVSLDDEATEILHRRQISEDAYGIPRWVCQLPSILGSRESEEVNLRYFEDNTIPPMFLTVAGGRLTQQSYKDLRSILDAQKVGKERQNQVVLLEAIPERDSLEDGGTVTLKIDKMTDARQGDGLFSQYDEANQSKVMASFRLAPINIGKSADHNYATAQIAMFVAESQVYGPERRAHDEWFNKRLVNNPIGLGLHTVQLRSRAPSITNPEMIVKSLTALNVMGGLTPRSAQALVFSLLRIEEGTYPLPGEDGYGEWMDQPLPLSLKSREGKPTADDGDQAAKDGDTRYVEGEGDVVPRAPEHGQE